MKKKLVILTIAATMIVGSTMTTLAADSANPGGGNTDVYVGVTTTTPKNVSVTVPTALAIAVVDDGTSIDTLLGNYMVDGTGNVTNSGDSAQGIKEQRVTFINTGDVNAKITSAKVVNSYGSQWTLKTTPAAAKEMSMKFNGISTGDIAPDHNSTIQLGGYALPKNQITHMPAEVRAGGNAGDYSIEKSAKSFVVEWNIEPTN